MTTKRENGSLEVAVQGRCAGLISISCHLSCHFSFLASIAKDDCHHFGLRSHVSDSLKKKRQVIAPESLFSKEILQAPPGDFCFHLHDYHYVSQAETCRLLHSLIFPSLHLCIPFSFPSYVTTICHTRSWGRKTVNGQQTMTVFVTDRLFLNKLYLLLNISG